MRIANQSIPFIAVVISFCLILDAAPGEVAIRPSLEHRPTADKVSFGFEDCNGNGISDDADVAAGTSDDCDTNGKPDECDLQGQAESFWVAPDDGAPTYYFASSLAIDGNSIAVGSYGKGSPSFRGAVTVYEKTNGQWAQAQELTASDGAANDYMGSRVAVSGDTIIAGAYGANFIGQDSGAAYVYRHVGGTWQEKQKLSASDLDAGDAFGFRVAISDNTAVITSAYDDNVAESAGAAYVFRRTTDTWIEIEKLTASDTSTGERFGWSAAIDRHTAVVGAMWDDDFGQRCGAVYVFRESESGWKQEAKLFPSDAQPDLEFGNSVAIDGDTLVVGARSYFLSSALDGTAYVFRRRGNTWTETGKLIPDDAGTGHQFGFDVAVSGDTILVGGRFVDYGAFSGGAAYMYRRLWGTWQLIAKLVPSRSDLSDEFGYAVSINRDTAVVGDFGFEGTQPEGGRVFLYPLASVSTDCDSNGMIDSCEVVADESLIDCNTNGIHDACENCADLDGDGVVTMDDFHLMRDALGHDVGDPAYNPCADYDGNGAIRFNDYRAWLACFRDSPTGERVLPIVEYLENTVSSLGRKN